MVNGLSSVNETIINKIRKFVDSYSKTKIDSPLWQTPLVGFAKANDPLFWELKKVISNTHATPKEILKDAKSVIVYFLPFEKEVVKSNKQGDIASLEWASAYVETNKLIIALNNHLKQELDRLGYVSKVLPPTHNFSTDTLISDWSHKHVAYIAGLGNFGYHRQLITEKGCCGRLGSLVTEAPLEPGRHIDAENCLNRYNGSCQVCSRRCPVNAISDKNFIRHDCYDKLIQNAERYKHLGLADVCGKCAAIVPCSFLNPVKKQIRKELNKGLAIEQASKEDLPNILELQKRAYQIEADRYNDPDLPPLKQTIVQVEEEFADQIFLKAVLKGSIVGSVRVKIAYDICTINKLFVDPEYLQQGIARKMMTEIEALTETVRRYELFTGSESVPALRLYESMGYGEYRRQEMATHTLVFLEKTVQ